MTWSPGETLVTPSPTSSTTPAPSCPSTVGKGLGIVPLTMERSEWHTPVAAIRTSTSPAFGGARSTSTTE